VAYNAATGARLWAARFEGHSADIPHALAVSPSGDKVFVTGGMGEPSMCGTVAYRASTGAQLWRAHYVGEPHLVGWCTSVAVSPNGAQVFVTGTTISYDSTGFDYVTIAYRTDTGKRLWLAVRRAGTR
jgi:DNA-binding beta-propeller fold protein YncE